MTYYICVSDDIKCMYISDDIINVYQMTYDFFKFRLTFKYCHESQIGELNMI